MLPHFVSRVTRGGHFLLAHVPSHHIAQSQDGTMLSLRTLWLNKINKHSDKVKLTFKIYKPVFYRDKLAYMVVFGDFDQVLHCCLQLVASHGGNYYSVQLGCKLPHVLLICVHQTLQKNPHLLLQLNALSAMLAMVSQ